MGAVRGTQNKSTNDAQNLSAENWEKGRALKSSTEAEQARHMTGRNQTVFLSCLLGGFKNIMHQLLGSAP